MKFAYASVHATSAGARCTTQSTGSSAKSRESAGVDLRVVAIQAGKMI